MTEKTLLHRILLACTNVGARLFRNHVGIGWQGRHLVFRSAATIQLKVNPGDVFIEQARPLRAGLCTGSSDAIGWQSITITPEMVGRKFAVFVAVEVKTERGRLSEQQSQFLRAVESAGGIAVEARDIDTVVARLRNTDS